LYELLTELPLRRKLTPSRRRRSTLLQRRACTRESIDRTVNAATARSISTMHFKFIEAFRASTRGGSLSSARVSAFLSKRLADTPRYTVAKATAIVAARVASLAVELSAYQVGCIAIR
jgi:hypothetical protein